MRDVSVATHPPVVHGPNGTQPLWLVHDAKLDYRALFAACLEQPLMPTQWLNREGRLQQQSYLAQSVDCLGAEWSASGGRPPVAFADWVVLTVFAAGGLEALLSFAMPSVQETWRRSWRVRGSAQRRPQQGLHPRAVDAAWQAMERLCARRSRFGDGQSALVARALAACHHVAGPVGLSRCATLLTAKGTLPLNLFLFADARAPSADTLALLAPFEPLPCAEPQPAAQGPAPAPPVRRRFFGPPAAPAAQP